MLGLVQKRKGSVYLVAVFLQFHLLNYFHIRWVYEGVIDDPYGEFFIAENKSLQKVLINF